MRCTRAGYADHHAQAGRDLSPWRDAAGRRRGGRRPCGDRRAGSAERPAGGQPPRRLADHGHASRRWPARRSPRAADRAPGGRHPHRTARQLAGTAGRARTRDPSRRAGPSGLGRCSCCAPAPRDRRRYASPTRSSTLSRTPVSTRTTRRTPTTSSSPTCSAAPAARRRLPPLRAGEGSSRRSTKPSPTPIPPSGAPLEAARPVTTTRASPAASTSSSTPSPVAPRGGAGALETSARHDRAPGSYASPAAASASRWFSYTRPSTSLPSRRRQTQPAGESMTRPTPHA